MNPSKFSKIPKTVSKMLTENQAEIVGGVVRKIGEKGSDRAIGYLQQTKTVEKLLDAIDTSLETPSEIVEFANSAASMGKEMLGGVSNLSLFEMGSLSLSATGIGIVVLSVNKILAKLGEIKSKMDELGEKIEEIRKNRRNDDFEKILDEIRADLDNISQLSTRSDPVRVAEQLQMSMPRNIRKLERIFSHYTESIDHDCLEEMWNLCRLIKLCQDATLKTLYLTDELETVKRFGLSESQHNLNLLKSIRPNRLALSEACFVFAKGEKKGILKGILDKSKNDFELKNMLDFFTQNYAEFNVLHSGIKGNTYSLANQVSIAKVLMEKGIKGKEFIEYAENESKSNFLFLPAS